MLKPLSIQNAAQKPVLFLKPGLNILAGDWNLWDSLSLQTEFMLKKTL